MMHELQIAPHRPCKSSEERGKEDGRKDFLAGPPYALQEGRLNESGQRACQSMTPPTSVGLRFLTG
jgi:hypothetical protein